MRDPIGEHDEQAGKPVSQKVSATIGRLRRRADFLRAAKGKRWHGKAFSLQAHIDGDSGGAPRIGLTVTKKVGNAVVRNRARRRLREAVRLHPNLPARNGNDYVLIARIEAVRLSFSALQDDLAQALRSVHARGRPPGKALRSGRADRDGRRDG